MYPRPFLHFRSLLRQVFFFLMIFFSLSISILFLFDYLLFPSLFIYFFEETSVSASVLSLCKDLFRLSFNILYSWNVSRTAFRYFTSFFFFVVVFALSDNFHVFDLFLHSSFSTCFVCACAHVKEVSFFYSSNF